jgi:hypothetical protein
VPRGFACYTSTLPVRGERHKIPQMTADENASASTAQDFTVMLDGCDKLDLMDVESELAGLNPTLHVLDESEHRYGEPGTLALIALAGSLALPPLMRWLANHRKGFKVTEQREMTLPDGTKVITLVKVSVTESAPPSPEQLRELAKFPGIDVARIARAFGVHLPGKDESSS